MIPSRKYSVMEKKLRLQCEGSFTIGPLGDGPVSPTGQQYRELINPGMKPVGSEKEAFDLAGETFRKYVVGRKGTIYWRVWPEIEKGKGGWKFYMRLLVSDKPRIKDGKGSASTARTRRTVNAVL